jgi:CubicO group peptidase (beta-lactamase class C family)
MATKRTILKSLLEQRSISRDIIQVTKCPGVSYGVLYKNEVVDLQSFGMADISRGVRVTSKTIFGISSLTKAFTATACALLELDGALNWSKSYLLLFTE